MLEAWRQITSIREEGKEMERGTGDEGDENETKDSSAYR